MMIARDGIWVRNIAVAALGLLAILSAGFFLVSYESGIFFLAGLGTTVAILAAVRFAKVRRGQMDRPRGDAPSRPKKRWLGLVWFVLALLFLSLLSFSVRLNA